MNRVAMKEKAKRSALHLPQLHPDLEEESTPMTMIG